MSEPSHNHLRKLAIGLMIVLLVIGVGLLGWVRSVNKTFNDNCEARAEARTYIKDVNELVFHVITTRRSDDLELVTAVAELQERAKTEFRDIPC